ncbi:MAG: 2,3-bisphosphoglycerate-independent phosphoglycerate mutase [Acidobacteria bacterium]|nr:2,3-bisphosphoglycerate-independent phosphoglycerate mutase [Acidobacteriota bacterium]MCI0723007.1 2,3-bisphosphoglycerate-independent phosphoglycerate mutase [Acidobacteriota bacterium]
MKTETLYQSLRLPNQPDTKLMLLVLDGIGDIATVETEFLTPLEAANTPNLDELAKASAMGRMTPVAPGITPGSGPGHLGLFGYDPLEYEVGRGVIEALGLGIELKPGDVAARANFCTLDAKGIVTDRRAGRIATEVNETLCAKLQKVKKVGNAEVIIRPGKSHRFVVVFRGKALEGPLTDSDPHREGLPIKKVEAAVKSSKAKEAAAIVNEFYAKALPLLEKERPANGFLLRGIAHLPKIPTFEERFGLKAGVIAAYPMYKGLAQLIGMQKLEGTNTTQEEFEKYLAEHANYNYFFIHVKGTDMAGEDGNFAQKVAVIEEVDRALPTLLQKKPMVLAITGDHSTPVPMKSHSWHPQPVMIHGPVSGSDKLDRFTETNANRGSLGVFKSRNLIRYMLANAKLFDKFGA